MAITAAPFALKNLGLDAEPLRQALASLVPNSGGLVQAGDLTISQTTVASLGVQPGVGRAWMPGNNTANLAGQSYSTQGQYFIVNDATPVTVNLSTANATNPRIDLIYVGAVDTFYGGASDVIKFDKITGTPNASPVAPTLPAGSNALALATVYVAANATSVTNANITNLLNPTLQPLPYMHSEWTFNSTGIPSATVWGMGTPTLDTSNTTDTGFITTPGTDRLTFRDAGVYAVTVFGSWGTATTARGFSQFTDASGNAVARASAAVNENTLSVALGNFKVAAGQNMTVSTYLTCSGTTSWTGRVRITRIR